MIFSKKKMKIGFPKPTEEEIKQVEILRKDIAHEIKKLDKEGLIDYIKDLRIDLKCSDNHSEWLQKAKDEMEEEMEKLEIENEKLKKQVKKLKPYKESSLGKLGQYLIDNIDINEYSDGDKFSCEKRNLHQNEKIIKRINQLETLIPWGCKSALYIGKGNDIWNKILLESNIKIKELKIVNYMHNFKSIEMNNILVFLKKNGVKLELLYGDIYVYDNKKYAEILETFKDQFNFLGYLESNHFKLVVSDKFACLGSMNFTKNSNNLIESLIIFEDQIDIDTFEALYQELKNLSNEITREKSIIKPKKTNTRMEYLDYDY